MWQNFSRMHGPNFQKLLSTLFVKVFLAENQKKILKMEKFENMMKEQSVLKRKRFHPSKRHLQQIWRAQNIPVVAECLIYIVL